MLPVLLFEERTGDDDAKAAQMEGYCALCVSSGDAKRMQTFVIHRTKVSERPCNKSTFVVYIIAQHVQHLLC